MSHQTYLAPTLLTVLLFGITTASMAGDGERVLFDFSKPDAAQAWQPVNDGVMGGVSDGRFKITDQGTMEFFGTLSPGEQRRLRLGAVPPQQPRTQARRDPPDPAPRRWAGNTC